MEIRIVIFLGFVAVVMIGNAVFLLVAFSKLAGAASKVTEAASEFHKGQAQAWIRSLEVASVRAVRITESAKIKLEESNRALGQTEESYRRTLAEIESKSVRVANDINKAAETMRDMVARPASSLADAAGNILRFCSRAL